MCQLISAVSKNSNKCSRSVFPLPTSLLVSVLMMMTLCRWPRVPKTSLNVSGTHIGMLVMTWDKFWAIRSSNLVLLVVRKLDLFNWTSIVMEFVSMFWSLVSLLKIVYLHGATGGNMSGTAVLILTCLTAWYPGRRPQLSQLPGGSKFSVVKMIKVIWSPNRVVTCQCHNLQKWGKFSLSPGLLLLLIWATSLDFSINMCLTTWLTSLIWSVKWLVVWNYASNN